MDSLPSIVTSYVEMTFLVKGTMEYVINDDIVQLQSGDVLVTRLNCSLSRKVIQHSDYVSFNFLPDEADLKVDLPLVTHNGISSTISALLFACDEIHLHNESPSSQLEDLANCLLKQLEVENNTTKLSELTIQIKNYLNANLKKTITLSDISAKTFFSLAYCSEVFKRDMGITIIEYAIKLKLEEAKHLIQQGFPLKDLHNQLGFTNYNYFSRLFKKKLGYTPSEYKKKFKKRILDSIAYKNS